MIYATGKKKTAIAKIFIKEIGDKNIEINKFNIKDYIKKNLDYKIVLYPLYLTKSINKFNIKIKVEGGGIKSQILAIKLGISRALVKYDENNKEILSRNNFLKRDSRIVERKNLGFKKSRKKKQFSKR